jgi:hypothetical protein
MERVRALLTSREAERDSSSGAFLFHGFGTTDDITGFCTITDTQFGYYGCCKECRKAKARRRGS